MKKKTDKREMVTVMIGGGDESMFIKVPKGSKIRTSYGNIIAGETYEENIARYEARFNEVSKRVEEENKRYEKELLKEQRPDLLTLLYLMLDNAKIVAHPEVFSLDTKRKMNITPSTTHEVYVFKDFEEYRNFFLMFLNNVDDDEIINTILCTSKKGYVVAYKTLCDRLIVTRATEEFYNSFSQEQIDDIHSRGKLTPAEFVEQCTSFDLCAPGDAIGSASNRCKFFSGCYECLYEYASHKKEYDKIDFKLINFDEQGHSRKREK